MNQHLILDGSIVGAVGFVVFFLSRALFGHTEDGKLRRRLKTDAAVEQQKKKEAAPKNAGQVLEKIGTAAAKPFMPKTREKQSAIRRNLGFAGIYAPNAARVMTGAKVIFLGSRLLGGYIAGLATGNLMMFLSLGGLVGYALPAFWLKTQIKKNRSEISLGLP